MSVGVLKVLSTFGFVSERGLDMSVGEFGSLDAKSFASPSNAAAREGDEGRPVKYLSLEGFWMIFGRVEVSTASTLIGFSCSLRKAQPRRFCGDRACASEAPPEVSEAVRSVVVVPAELMFGLNVPNVDLQ